MHENYREVQKISFISLCAIIPLYAFTKALKIFILITHTWPFGPAARQSVNIFFSDISVFCSVLLTPLAFLWGCATITRALQKDDDNNA